MRRWLARTPVAAVGVGLATACGILFLLMFTLELLGWLQNPYIGLVVYVALPLGLVFGLLLVPVGNWLGRRAVPGAEWPRIDLNDPRHRRIAILTLAATLVNVGIVSVGTYGGIHAMETNAFCGQVCHTVMEPQFTAYQDGPHSRVDCVACHVGAGATATAQSKLRGTRQLFGILSGRYPRPVGRPVHDMRPARETCERCHWPEKYHGDRMRTVREYGDDEESTESVTLLTVHVGGGSEKLGVAEGIHWHMNLGNRIEYVATDETRQTIPYVRLTTSDGTVKEYRVEGVTDEDLARGIRRRMDCMDCHNRPAHNFAATPERAVDQAIAMQRVSRSLPFVRQQMVAALAAAYPSTAAARDGIASGLRDFYSGDAGAASNGGGSEAELDRVISVTQDLYRRNVFPEMHVAWGTYPSNLGHTDAPGCFRCHDEEHATPDGEVLGQDCESCHGISFE